VCYSSCYWYGVPLILLCIVSYYCINDIAIVLVFVMVIVCVTVLASSIICMVNISVRVIVRA